MRWRIKAVMLSVEEVGGGHVEEPGGGGGQMDRAPVTLVHMVIGSPAHWLRSLVVPLTDTPAYTPLLTCLHLLHLPPSLSLFLPLFRFLFTLFSLPSTCHFTFFSFYVIYLFIFCFIFIIIFSFSPLFSTLYFFLFTVF